MKKVFLIGMFLVGSQAFAAPVLNCSTSGDGLANMTVDSTGKIAIQFSEDTEEIPTTYVIKSGLKDVVAKTSATVIAQKAGSNEEFGGTIGDALMLRILDGQKKAYLSVNGDVHRLHCR
jgi:hypothetical protein